MSRYAGRNSVREKWSQEPCCYLGNAMRRKGAGEMVPGTVSADHFRTTVSAPMGREGGENGLGE
jgi:hypothetical protein